MKKPNANVRVLRALASHQNTTTRQVQSRARIVNVSARVAELRDAGFPIYTNTRYTKATGRRYFYRLAEPVVKGRKSSKKAAARKTARRK
jgi:hypothetical protein